MLVTSWYLGMLCRGHKVHVRLIMSDNDALRCSHFNIMPICESLEIYGNARNRVCV